MVSFDVISLFTNISLDPAFFASKIFQLWPALLTELYLHRNEQRLNQLLLFCSHLSIDDVIIAQRALAFPSLFQAML